MENSDKNNDQIERYIYGHMNDNERIEFEKKISMDELLAKEVALSKMEKGVLVAIYQQDLREDMKSWSRKKDEEKGIEKEDLVAVHEQDLKEDKKNQTREEDEGKGQKSLLSFIIGNKNLFRAAAAVVLIGGCWWLLSTQSSNPNQYFPSEYTMASRNEVQNISPLQEALELMKINNRESFEKALLLLDPQKNPEYAESIHFHRGQCYYWLQDFDKAKREFLTIVEKPLNPDKEEEAMFCLMLTYWKTNDIENARIYREKIIQIDGVYKSKAMELKNKF